MTGYLRGTIVKPSPESGDFYVIWCTDLLRPFDDETEVRAP